MGSMNITTSLILSGTTIWYLEIFRSLIAGLGIILSIIALIVTRMTNLSTRTIIYILRSIFIANIICNIPQCLILGPNSVYSVPKNFECPLFVTKGLLFRFGSLALACTSLCLAGSMAASFWMPIRYRVWCHGRANIIWVALIWTPPFASVAYIIFKWIVTTYSSKCSDLANTLKSTIAFSVVPITVLAALNFLIYLMVFCSVFFLKRSVVPMQYRQRQEMERRKRVLELVSAITFTYLICTIPSYVFFVFCNLKKNCMNGDVNDDIHVIKAAFLLLRVTNSILYPIFCCITVSQLRKLLGHCLCIRERLLQSDTNTRRIHTNVQHTLSVSNLHM